MHAPPRPQLWNEDQGFFKVNQPLTGDFVVIARFKGTDGGAETGPEGVLFRYCNHTCFLPAGAQVSLGKSQVDVMPSYRDQIPDDVFKVNLIIVPDDDDDAGSGFSFQEQEQVKVGPAATQQGLADLSSFHFVTPSLPRLDKLLGQGFPPEASTLALQLSNNDLNAAVSMMEETALQDLMTYRLTLSPRSSEGFSPTRGGLRSKSISVVSPGSLLESDQGDLSLDHYDDSHHSRGSFGGLGGSGGIGALGISSGSLSIRASSGFPRENSGGFSASSAAPWGSGLGGLGKHDANGGGGGQHHVVPGGIWLPTPRTQGTSSFSPGSSGGVGGGVGGGGAGAGGIGVIREREEGGAGQGGGGGAAANGGFFGSEEPRCARCSNTDQNGQAQV
ncbi:unnamed protein product, partial [Hapterophycus canaliculatus]